MSCVYYSRRFCIHDQKFLRLLNKLEVPTHAVFIDRSDYPIGDLSLLSYNVLADLAEEARSVDDVRVEAFGDVLRRVSPHWIIAGPLWPCAYDAVDAQQPLLAISWAFDLVIDAANSPQKHQYICSALRRANSILFDNPAIYKIAKKMVENLAKTYVFPWGVDTRLFSPRPKESVGNREVYKEAIHNRGLTDIYRPDFILNGFLESRKLTSHLRLVFQSSTDVFESFLRKRQADCILTGVSHIESQDNSLLAETLNRFDIYVTASESDGTSISLLEAMACGLLVLVPNSEANLHVIGRKNALLQSFEPGNLRDFARKISDLSMLSIPRSKRLRFENRARCVSGFSKAIFEKGFVEMISDFRSRNGV